MTSPTKGMVLPWIELADGQRYHYGTNDLPSTSVIARSLSRIPRFGGHGRRNLTVAEHSIIVAAWYAESNRPHAMRHARWALLHDAHESVLGDMMTPLKEALGCLRLKELALQFDRALAEAEGFNYDSLDIEGIKRADMDVLMAEARLYMPSEGREWNLPPASYACFDFVESMSSEWQWGPDEARPERLQDWFMETYHELEGTRR